MQLEKGDILGHEWCGIVEDVGSSVQNFKKGIGLFRVFRLDVANAIIVEIIYHPYVTKQVHKKYKKRCMGQL